MGDSLVVSTAMDALGPIVYGVLTKDGLVKFGHFDNWRDDSD
jgi:hypothetical protein